MPDAAALHPPMITPEKSPAGRSWRPPAVVAVLLLAASATGCASYPARTAAALHDFRSGQFDRALEAYGDTETTGSEFLAGVEAGTVALTAGEWDEALAQLHRAAEASAEIEGRALIGTERLGEALATWALNDTAASYVGEGFERVYLHCGLAIAYLAQGLLDDVGVEVRLANRLLETEEELYEKEYRAGGLGHFLSAVSYELRGEPDQAYLDYRRMVEKGVGTELAGKALVRLARRLGRTDELAELEQRFGPAADVPPDAASVILIAGVGLGPYKVEGSLAVPTPDGLLTMAAPAYEERPQPVSRLRLTLAETGESLLSDRIESVSEVAAENLQDRLLWTAAKSVARGILKREMTKRLQDEYGWGGRLVGDLFAFVSERADLRFWQTLPESWHGARMFVTPGIHGFTLEAVGGETVQLGPVELLPGETLVLLARSIDTRLYAHLIGGGLVQAGGEAPQGPDLDALLGTDGGADSPPTQP